MSERKRTSPAKQKVLDAACELFYGQGYHATTVDQIIDKSGVSKPTVYSHFPTKEDLCVEYIKLIRKAELGILKDALRKAKTPDEKFLCIVRTTRERMRATNLRGCPFFNMVSELVSHENPVVAEAKRFIEGYSEIVSDTIEELKNTDARFKNVDVEKMSKSYYVLVCGGIMAAVEHQDLWPLDNAVEQVEGLLPD